MGHWVRLLLSLIRTFRLDDRFEHVAFWRQLAERGELSEDDAEMLVYQIEPLIEQQRNLPNLLWRPPTVSQFHAEAQPDVELGSLTEVPGCRFGVRLLKCVRNILVCGAAGAGKSTLLRRLVKMIDGLAAKTGRRIVLIIIDMKGGDYSDMKDLLAGEVIHVSVHEGLRLGLNAPYGVPPDVWINIVSSTFGARAGLVASTMTFANVLRWLVRELNRGQTFMATWASFRLVLDVLTAISPEVFAGKQEYAQSLRHALESVTQASGELFDAFNGLDLERDLVSQGKSLVIDMPNLQPPFLRLFVVDLLILQLLVGRIHRKYKTDGTDVMYIIDEADPLVARAAEEQFPDRMSPESLLLKHGRELGLGAAIGLHLLGQASRLVLSNAHYHCIFSLGDAESAVEAAKTTNLPRGAEILLPGLRPGECIFRQSLMSWPHAVKCVVDPFPPCRIPKTSGFDVVPFVPARRLSELPTLQKALQELAARHRATAWQQPRKSKKPQLSPNAQTLLELATLNPFTPFSRLWDSATKKLSAGPQNKARDELEKKNLAVFEEVRLGKMNVLLVSVKEAGWQALGKRAPSGLGGGGVEHRHIAHWIAEVGRKRRYKTIAKEWVVPDTSHRVDAAWFDGAWHVFEVVITCDGNIVTSLESCLANDSPVADVTVVATQLNILNDLRQRVLSAPSLEPYHDRVKFEVAETFYKELWP